MSEQSALKTNYGALITLTTVFFFWGFVAASNDILIPVFKKELDLAQWQSQMISFAFYVAYTVGSIIYLIASSALKRDILSKIGYKKRHLDRIGHICCWNTIVYPSGQIGIL